MRVECEVAEMICAPLQVETISSREPSMTALRLGFGPVGQGDDGGVGDEGIEPREPREVLSGRAHRVEAGEVERHVPHTRAGHVLPDAADRLLGPDGVSRCDDHRRAEACEVLGREVAEPRASSGDDDDPANEALL